MERPNRLSKKVGEAEGPREWVGLGYKLDDELVGVGTSGSTLSSSEIVWNCSSRSLGIFYEMLSATHRDFDVISVFDDLLTK